MSYFAENSAAPGAAVPAGNDWRITCKPSFALVIAGQVLAAVTLDHFGALGLAPHPVSIARLLGAVLLIAGVALIRD